MAVSDTRIAGSALRLNRSDLIKLFEDAENGTDTSEFFDIPLQNVQTTGTSDVTGSFLSKGRGNVLGYREGGRPTVGYQGPAEAIRELINTPKPTSTAAKSESEGTSKLKKFTGTVGGVPITDIGEKGFGMKDYNVAVAAGYDPASIEEWVKSNQSSLYNIGPEAQKTLGVTGYASTTPGVFDYTQFGESGFGMKDVEALRSQGVSEGTLRTLAAQAPKVGPEASRQLGYTPSQKQTARVAVENFDYGAAGQAGFGMEDVKALMSKGASTEQMRELARRAPGGQIGPAARELLGL